MTRLEGGGTETAWCNYSLSPLRDEDDVAAVLHITPETTDRVLLRTAWPQLNSLSTSRCLVNLHSGEAQNVSPTISSLFDQSAFVARVDRVGLHAIAIAIAIAIVDVLAGEKLGDMAVLAIGSNLLPFALSASVVKHRQTSMPKAVAPRG